MLVFYLFLLPSVCYAVPLREWAELDFIDIPVPASGGVTGGVCDSGLKQSPIDLTVCYPQNLDPLRLSGHGDNRPEGFVIKNTGHSAQISYNGAVQPKLLGGPLLADYTLAQLHFHWGTANLGSEHSIEGTFYALEGHFVHFKTSYGTVADAATHSDGLAVVGIMFEISATDNADLAPIVSSLSLITDEFSTTPLGPAIMTWFHPFLTQFDYYTYPGSLTTSPCAESVTWLVMKNKSKVSVAQLAEFRKLNGPNGLILENSRGVQPLNGRSVRCEVGC